MPERVESVMSPESRRSPSDAAPVRGAPLPVVDAHVQLGDASAFGAVPTEPGANPDALAPLRDFLEARGGCHLLRAVHVQPSLPWAAALADVRRMEAVAGTPGSAGLPTALVVCCDLTGDGVDARLDALSAHASVRGVTLPDRAPLPPTLDALVRRGLLLELRGAIVPIDRLVELASENPDSGIVVNVDTGRGVGSRADTSPDSGADPSPDPSTDLGPDSRTDTRADTRAESGAAQGTDQMNDLDKRAVEWQRLGRHDNVLVKLVHRDVPGRPSDSSDLSDLSDWKDSRDLSVTMERAIDAFGHDRVMLASGHVSGDSARPWHAAWRAFDVATRGLRASRRNALLRTNAVRTYRL